MNPVRKKWIVVIYISVGNIAPEHVADAMEAAKNNMPEETFASFFETDVLPIYIPTRTSDSRIEVHEIILDAVGYDKYETVINNTNLNVRDVLDQLKELLDV